MWTFIVTKVFYIALALSLVCLLGVYYFEYLFYFSGGDETKGELLVGAAMVTVFTWPVWLG